MNLWDKLVNELAAHQITVQQDGNVVLHTSYASSKSGTFAPADLSRHLLSKAKENSTFLMSLWTGLIKLGPDHISHPGNEGTRRLFVSAIQHLVRLSGTSRILAKAGVHLILCRNLLEDVAKFSQDIMNKVIDYRLAIDWVSHLVSYDMHRAELVEALKLRPHIETTSSSTVMSKLAFSPFTRDFSYTSAEPWTTYKDSLIDSRPTAENSLTQDKTLLQQQREYTRFNDPHAPLVGKTFVGQTVGQDGLLPSPDLPTEDPDTSPGGQLANNINGRPELWSDLSNGAASPGSMRIRTPGR
jgi:hypothetical protein